MKEITTQLATANKTARAIKNTSSSLTIYFMYLSLHRTYAGRATHTGQKFLDQGLKTNPGSDRCRPRFEQGLYNLEGLSLRVFLPSDKAKNLSSQRSHLYGR